MNWKKTVYYSGGTSVLKSSVVIQYPLLSQKSESVKNVLNLTRLPIMHKHIRPRTFITAGTGGTHSNSNDKDFLENVFFNQCFDKGRLKNFVLWFLKNYGQNKTVKLVEQLKNIGFEYASKAGISLGVDDLKIPYTKYDLVYEAERRTTDTIHQYVRGEITGVERFQRLIDTWHRTSESLKQEVIDYFESTDILNPVYMMAFSGARGNISQVRQLVGMRGLMADPQGQIIDFPIRSNFREGLTLTEYLISSYGARKGIVDTALRTANAGYLTRRLVDVAQHVIISHFDCGTHRGIFLKDMKEGNKTIYSLIQRVVGRILARDLIDPSLITKHAFEKREFSPGNFVSGRKENTGAATTHEDNISLVHLSLDQNNPRRGTKQLKGEENSRQSPIIAKRNDEITMELALSIVKKFDKIFVRSPLTCETNQLICQLCYGWSLGQGSTLVSIGEAVGVVAAQSIGEPGTQLTMRTFHTGGVFSGDISDQIRAPFDAFVEYPTAIPGTLIRTPEGKIAFLTKGEGSFFIKKQEHSVFSEMFNENRDSSDASFSPKTSTTGEDTTRKFKIPSYTLLYIRNKQSVNEKEVIAQITTISRKSNATDAAELTIQSEYEGQFFSKSLYFREKFVGDAKLIESSLSQIRSAGTDLPRSGPVPSAVPAPSCAPPVKAVGRSGESRSGTSGSSEPGQGQKNLSPDIQTVGNVSSLLSGPGSIRPSDRGFDNIQKKQGILNERFNINHIDKLYESWTWGYAWVLSGKIYELNLIGETCFPRLGDLVNSQSSMNQTQWNWNFNNGPAKLYYPSKELPFGSISKSYLPLVRSPQDLKESKSTLPLSSKLSKLFNPTASRNVLIKDPSIRRTGRNALLNQQNEQSATVNAQKFLHDQSFVSPTSNVTIAQPFFFLDILKIRFKKYGYILTSRKKYSSFENPFFGEEYLRNDLLFRMYDIHPRISNSLVKTKNFKTPQKKQIVKGNRTLLHWFPNQSQTSTGGFIIYEKVFHNSNYYYSSMNPNQIINVGGSNLSNGKIPNLNLVGQNGLDISWTAFKDKNGLTFSDKQHNIRSKNLEFFGSSVDKSEVDPGNIDSSLINSSLPQLRSGCIQSPLHKPIKLHSFMDIRRSLEDHFYSDIANRPKFSPVNFIKGRGLETVGLQSFANEKGHRAALSLKNLYKNMKHSTPQSNNVISVIHENSYSEIDQIEKNKKSFFSHSRPCPVRLTGGSRRSAREGGGQERPQIDNFSGQKSIMRQPMADKSYFNMALKKHSISPSFKADFIKQLNMEWNYEKTQWISVNNSFKVAFFKREFSPVNQVSGRKDKETSFKGDKFKGFRREPTKVKPLSSEIFKSRVFGMRWKNPYQICIKSRLDNLYSANNNNKEKTTSLDSSIINPHLTVPSISSDVKRVGRSSASPLRASETRVEDARTPNLQNDNLNSLFNKRILWIPNQFFQLIRTPFYSRDKLSSNNIVNLRPKEAPLFFSKPPLFLQTNRQGHLKPFTSFINFPSLLNIFNSYKGKRSDLEFDVNSITNKTLSCNIFTKYKEYSINESFGLSQNWSYCHQKSNESIPNTQNNSLNLSHFKNKKILLSTDFPIKKKPVSPFSYNKNSSLGQVVYNFITFCTLSVFNEKKLKVAFEKREFSPGNKVSGRKLNFGKRYRPLSRIPNSIKRQLNKLNGITNKEQLSLYLLSLNFTSPFISTSFSTPVNQTLDHAETSASKHRGQNSSINTHYLTKLQPLNPNRGVRASSTRVSDARSGLAELRPTSHTDFNTAILTNDNSLMTGKSFMTNLNLKKGWIYFANNPLKMLSYHKTIIYPGQINDFQLNSSRPLYLECHSITDVYDVKKHCFSSVFNSDNISNVKLEHSHFPTTTPFRTLHGNFKNKKFIKNLKSRFILCPGPVSSGPPLCGGSLPAPSWAPPVRAVGRADGLRGSALSGAAREDGGSVPTYSSSLTKIKPNESAGPNQKNSMTSTHFVLNYPTAPTDDYQSESNNSSWDFLQQKRHILLSYLSQLELFKDTSLSKNNISNNIVLIIQPIEEYTQMNTKELKTYVSESTLKEDPVYTIQNVGSSNNRHSSAGTCFREGGGQKRHQRILISPYLSSLLKKRLFKIQQFNKQKLGSPSLSKFPTSDIQIYPMAIDNQYAIETSLGNEKIKTPYYRGLNIKKRPINLSPFFISYTRPMGFDSVFKDQEVSLSYQSFSQFDSVVAPFISSYLSSFFNLYLMKKTKQKHAFKKTYEAAYEFNPVNEFSEIKVKNFNYTVNPFLLGDTKTQKMASVKQSFNPFPGPVPSGPPLCGGSLPAPSWASPVRAVGRYGGSLRSALTGAAREGGGSVPADDFISRLVESPCFCFQNIFKFKNPILTFENLQRDFFRSSKLSSNALKYESITKKKKRKPSSNVPKTRTFYSLSNSNSDMSSTLFSYSQRNEMFLGVRPVAKTNIFSPFNGEVVLLNVTKGCMVLTTSNLTSYYIAPKGSNFNQVGRSSASPLRASETRVEDARTNNFNQPSFNKYYQQNDNVMYQIEKTLLQSAGTGGQEKLSTRYPINNILVRFLNMTDIKLDVNLVSKLHGGVIPTPNNTNNTNNTNYTNNTDLEFDPSFTSTSSSQENDQFKNDYQSQGVISNIKSKMLKVSNLVGGKPDDLNIKVRLGDFCVYGDPITNTTAIQTSGQLVHFNNQKITLRRSQPIFISPKGILHKFDNDFIDPKTPVITLSYQKLKTGDIIQGIPKVEQFFEARTTKRGRFFRDSLPYLLKSLFKRYSTKLPLDLAVRQSFYKIQQILVDGVHRVYKAQGVTISDKHLEVIVKQMTSKVRIIDGAQTGFFQGEVLDLFFVEKINSFLMKKMTYEPLVLGITKASLEVDSFLSAASFQQTTRVLSKAAIFRKKDFLKGLKENVILGNLIPAGTGFLVYIDL